MISLSVSTQGRERAAEKVSYSKSGTIKNLLSPPEESTCPHV